MIRMGEEEGEAAMFAYVTFRMTLAGHTGLLPHQFSAAARGDIISRAHTHTVYVYFPLSFSPPPATRTPYSPIHPPTPCSTTPWLYLAAHTRSPRLAGESRKHSPCSPASETLLGNKEAVLLQPQATAAAPLSSTLCSASLFQADD